MAAIAATYDEPLRSQLDKAQKPYHELIKSVIPERLLYYPMQPSRVKEVRSLQDKLERSRLANNPKQWHELSDYCGMRAVMPPGTDPHGIVAALQSLQAHGVYVQKMEKKVGKYVAYHIDLKCATPQGENFCLLPTPYFMIEVQVRDIFADVWATTSHKVSYKQTGAEFDGDLDRIHGCFQQAQAALDNIGRTRVLLGGEDVEKMRTYRDYLEARILEGSPHEVACAITSLDHLMRPVFGPEIGEHVGVQDSALRAIRKYTTHANVVACATTLLHLLGPHLSRESTSASVNVLLGLLPLRFGGDSEKEKDVIHRALSALAVLTSTDQGAACARDSPDIALLESCNSQHLDKAQATLILQRCRPEAHQRNA